MSLLDDADLLIASATSDGSVEAEEWHAAVKLWYHNLYKWRSTGTLKEETGRPSGW